MSVIQSMPLRSNRLRWIDEAAAPLDLDRAVFKLAQFAENNVEGLAGN